MIIEKDLYIYDNETGGELNLVNNDLQLTSSLFNQVYLTLFGSVLERQWFGNELLPFNNRFLGNTWNLLENFVITNSNLDLLENTVKKDLRYLNQYGDIIVDIEHSGYNRINIKVEFKSKGNIDNLVPDIKIKPDIGIGEMIVGFSFIVR